MLNKECSKQCRHDKTARTQTKTHITIQKHVHVEHQDRTDIQKNNYLYVFPIFLLHSLFIIS